MNKLLQKLFERHTLSLSEYEQLILAQTPTLLEQAAQLAETVRAPIYGKDVYVRGLVEIGNVCRNDCLYCGIRRSNQKCDRYRLTPKEILDCCDEGYTLGFRTFVLQGGEGGMDIETVCQLVRALKAAHPDCAVTLSLGEWPRQDYQKMFDAGADRYLLRHETADISQYRFLHPREMSYQNRMRCLFDLKEIGFQVGCGFMVGAPGQTPLALAKSLKFIEKFQPDMCGIGPFIPQKDTPLGDQPAGQTEQVLFLLSLIRLIQPNILLPATTALGTVDPSGRERGILAGANVVMPNLSPTAVRKKYALYDNKICTGDESAQCRDCLSRRMKGIGFNIVTHRGDIKK